MPRLDKTGPAGQGPMTGRGLGHCGAGFRRGWGCPNGYGYGRGFVSPKNYLAALQEDEKTLQQELTAVREEIAALKDQQ